MSGIRSIVDLNHDEAESLFSSASSATEILSLAISGTSAEVATQLAVGCWEMWGDTDFHFRRGATGGTAVTTDRLVFAGQMKRFRVTNATTGGYVQAITGGATGRIWLEKVA